MALPINTQPHPTILELIEGWRRAVDEMRGAFDISGIVNMCQAGEAPVEVRQKLIELETAIAAFEHNVSACIARQEAA